MKYRLNYIGISIFIFFLLFLTQYISSHSQFFKGQLIEDKKSSQKKELNEIEEICSSLWPDLNNPRLTFYKGSKQYNEFINCVFNTVIKKLEISYKNNIGEKICKTKDKKYYDIIKNTSIYFKEHYGSKKEDAGIAPVLLEKMKKYEKFLTNKKDNFSELKNKSINKREVLFASINDFNRQIENEKEKVRTSLMMTLTAYNEMRILYPVHMRLRCAIYHLQKYRDQLARIRTQVRCLPSRFINAHTSVQCNK